MNAVTAIAYHQATVVKIMKDVEPQHCPRQHEATKISQAESASRQPDRRFEDKQINVERSCDVIGVEHKRRRTKAQ
jgi:hypothetical protein